MPVQCKDNQTFLAKALPNVTILLVIPASMNQHLRVNIQRNVKPSYCSLQRFRFSPVIHYRGIPDYFQNLPNKTMKRLLAYVATGSLLVASCTESNLLDEKITQSNANGERSCVSRELLESKLQTDPKLKERYESIERHTKSMDEARLNSLGQIEIPVIINVLYVNDVAAENLTMDRIQSQIDALNRDFNAANPDVVNTPQLFAPLVADLDIQFVLAGVNRRKVNKYWWDTNDAMKSSKKGGIAPTNPTEYLNIWLVPGLLHRHKDLFGYAQFPGGNPQTDGVVISTTFFGTVGAVNSAYGKGRSTTHNVGHWMNLHDIWGVRTCGDDLVADTPQANASNIGTCPVYPHYSTCAGTPIEMFMNYMDEPHDECRIMFTQGQKSRALAVFAPGGPRASFAD